MLQDTAGGKVQDTAKKGTGLDLFGGGNTGKSPQEKAGDLVQQAEKPNPNSSFLGNLFGIDEKKVTFSPSMRLHPPFTMQS